ncbi:hypothetical protein MMC25_004816 [Agyrium rufum]|nr:hypothetical protein [Agyrium rufum]
MSAQQQSVRPRSKSMLSFAGSHKSSNSIPKITDLTESPTEKSRRRMTTKADPNVAMNDAQPAAQALEKTTMDNLRATQHKDTSGNIITDPDLSNPTRHRFERPLDTIRSFEAAIDGSYNRRYSQRAESYQGAQSRRSSAFFSGTSSNFVPQQQRYNGDGGGGYYGNRGWNSRPESYVGDYYNNNGPPQGRRFGPRTQSDPALYGQNSELYPTHNYQKSYDTVTTAASGSHATDQYANSTNPSSENSSVDRIQQPSKDLGEQYGFSGFGGAPPLQGPILEEHRQGNPLYGQPGYGQRQGGLHAGTAYQGNSAAPPPPPPHDQPAVSRPRVPMKLGKTPPTQGQSNSYSSQTSPESPTPPEGKRRSWLMRRFSKKE